MSKNLINIIILTILFLISFQKDKIEDTKSNIIDLNVEFSKEFKTYIIKYLKDNSLYQNDSILINKKTFRKIFIDILNTGDNRVVKVFQIFKEIYDKVCTELIKDIYPKGTKTIKASELEKYFEYDKIMDKFNNYLENNKEEDL